MDSVENQTSDESVEQLNYFNYFTEIEEEFVRRRGKPLLVSPLDWALIESWKSAGIPLHIVLRGINESFDALDKRAPKHQRVNSLLYCEPQVEETYAAYRLAQVGAATTEPASESDQPKKPRKREAQDFPRDALLSFLARCDTGLLGASENVSPTGELASAMVRARDRLTEIRTEVEEATKVDAEALERDLDAIDRMLMDAAITSTSEDQLATLRKEAGSQLRGHRKKMDKAIYEQTIQNFVARRLRETHSIPRLSLFYL